MNCFMEEFFKYKKIIIWLLILSGHTIILSGHVCHVSHEWCLGYSISSCIGSTLQWRHNGRHGVSNHQPHHCLLNRLFGRRSNKISKLRLCAGNSPGPVNSPPKGSVTRKMFPFDDVIMNDFDSSVDLSASSAVIYATKCLLNIMCSRISYTHYSDVIMSAMASQITSLKIAYSTVYSEEDKKTSKLRATGLCAGNSLMACELPAQRASNAENVSVWWRHHD